VVVPPPVNPDAPGETTNAEPHTSDDEPHDAQPRLKNPQRESGGGVRPGAERPQMERPLPERPQVPRAERRLRGLMASFGFDDPEMQDSLISYINTEVRSRAQLRQKAGALLEALRNAALSEMQVQALLQSYRDAVQTEKERRRLAEDELDDKVDYRNNARLESMLLLFGFVGDNPVIVPLAPQRPNYVGPTPNTAPRRIVEANAERLAQANTVEPPRLLTGIVLERRADGLDVRDDNGVVFRFALRATGPAGVPVERLDPVVLRAVATLKAGDKVRVMWLLEEPPRIVEVQRVDPPKAAGVAPEETMNLELQNQMPEFDDDDIR
jgi:hypothetical protein